MIPTMCKIVSLSIPLVKNTFVDGTRHFKLYCKLMICCSFSRYYGLFTIRKMPPVATTNGLNRSADRFSHIFIKIISTNTQIKIFVHVMLFNLC